MTYQLSNQQQNVVDWAVNGSGSLNLIARAGCGKTFTLLRIVEALITAKPNVEIFLGAFNKAIADEIKADLAKLGISWKQATAGTMHSAGFGVWRKHAPRVKVDGKKLYHIIDDIIASDGDEAYRGQITALTPFVIKAVSLAKQQAFGVLCGIEDRSIWWDLVEHFGLDDDLPENGSPVSPENGIELAIKVYQISLQQCREVVDFDDMILAPLYYKLRFWPKDFVLIDEAQDTNPARRALAMKMLKPRTGRMIAVGDDRQAIYGFTGASSDSLELIRKQLGSKVLPLNLTYRCAKKIVQQAQRYVPDIVAHDSNPEGVVETIPLDEFTLASVRPTDAILCRNTKPLINLAYEFVRAGIGCRVEGREIGQGLIALAVRWKRIKTITALTDKLTDYKDREIQKHLAKGREERAQGVEDKVATVLAIAQHVVTKDLHDVSDLVAEIEKMFGDTREGETPNVVTLSTIHKAKGREWDRVFILGFSKYLPSKWARKDWQLHQEDNLAYVAITRAKRDLFFLEE